MKRLKKEMKKEKVRLSKRNDESSEDPISSDSDSDSDDGDEIED